MQDIVKAGQIGVGAKAAPHRPRQMETTGMKGCAMGPDSDHWSDGFDCWTLSTMSMK